MASRRSCSASTGAHDEAGEARAELGSGRRTPSTGSTWIREGFLTYGAQGPRGRPPRRRRRSAVEGGGRDHDVQPHAHQPVDRQRRLLGRGVREARLADEHVALRLEGLAADLRPRALDVLAAQAEGLVPAADLDVGAVQQVLVDAGEDDAGAASAGSSRSASWSASSPGTAGPTWRYTVRLAMARTVAGRPSYG